MKWLFRSVAHFWFEAFIQDSFTTLKIIPLLHEFSVLYWDPGNHGFLWFAFSRMSCGWTPMNYGIFRLISFTYQYTFKVSFFFFHDFMVHFLLLNNTSFPVCTAVYLLTYWICFVSIQLPLGQLQSIQWNCEMSLDQVTLAFFPLKFSPTAAVWAGFPLICYQEHSFLYLGKHLA